jgi:hypothetical protein
MINAKELLDYFSKSLANTVDIDRHINYLKRLIDQANENHSEEIIKLANRISK